MTYVILPPKKYADYYGNIHVGGASSCACASFMLVSTGQVSTGFLIIRSRNFYRCLHGFMCDKTALLVNIL